MDLADVRDQYGRRTLRRIDLAEGPIEQFKLWLAEAMEERVLEPTAMSLVTASAAGIPSARTVLLKAFDERGFVFYSHRDSRKAREIRENRHAVLLFHWRELERQVIISGEAREVSKERSEEYFRRRPRESQIGAWASRQGVVLRDREELEASYRQRKEEFEGREIPVPEWWWGAELEPQRIEFWQGGPNRLHDRFHFLKENSRWRVERLSP